ncbi:MAG TPA: ABC transporter substrate-binding protein [Acidimicrobiia bacterium]|nr:ABC transporter substrate-binding protein [Acidimicrobiia bacterium]
MRRSFRKRAVGAVLVLALVATACGSGDSTDEETTVPGGEPTVADGEPIVVASFNFNESVIVAEIYAQALEQAGYTVERNMNLGAREVVKPALESGEIDLVPEYVGAINSFLGGTPTSDSQMTWEEAKELFEEKGVTLLAYSPAQDKNAYVVTAETAEANGLTTISDLEPVAGEFRFGGPPECPEREFCLQGLQTVYGLEFAEFVPLDAAGPITIAALEGGDVDLALLFSSQGVIAEKGWVVLEDDMGLQPADNLVPAIRMDVLDAYGEDLETLLNEVSVLIEQDALTEMNKRADIDGEDAAVIAGEWLEANYPAE